MFSISGRRPQDNLFLLNGIEYTGASLINVTPGGTSGQLLGVEAVREIQRGDRRLHGANYGKRTGAQVSIITAFGQQPTEMARFTNFCATRPWTPATTSIRRRFRSSNATILGRLLVGRFGATSFLPLEITRATGST